MNISRREFLIGGAAFATLGAFAGNRFLLAEAGFKTGEKPRLRFGVLSDIHILRIGADEKMSGGGNNLTFKHALEWFRSQDVDAVVIAGDMADKGMDDTKIKLSIFRFFILLQKFLSYYGNNYFNQQQSIKDRLTHSLSQGTKSEMFFNNRTRLLS